MRTRAASYAPKEFGVLDKPRMGVKNSKDVQGNKREFTVEFMTEYAAILETKKWGPLLGKPYKPNTQKKFNRLGTPIGPYYAARALGDFKKQLKKDPPKYEFDPETFSVGFKIPVSYTKL